MQTDKLLWNSLLISISILLPTTSTSVVFAESLKTSKSPALTVSTSEVLPVSSWAILTADSIPQPPDWATDAIAPMTVGSVESIVAQEASPAKRPETIVVPVVTETPSAETGSDRVTGPSSPTSTPSDEEASSESEAQPDSQPSDSTQAEEPKLSPEELAQQQKLIEADQLYQSGQIAAAEKLYREAKDPFVETDTPAKEQAKPIDDPAQLSPGAAVYWRLYQAGVEQKLRTKIIAPLQLLIKEFPEFIPGHLRYAQVLKEYDQPEEALKVLEQASSLYPNEPELLKAKIATLSEQENWLEASLSARQFALLNPDNPQSSEFQQLADENLARYKRHLRRKLRGNTIANAITGALGFVFTGSLFGPISAVESTVLLLRGESAVGESVAKQAKRQLPLMEDEQVLNYVQEIGNKLTAVAGRNDFQYEFYVVMDDRLNAFALPGGKVFVHAGAILKTKSEAELAGLLAHELSHAVLSHGFQLVTEGNFIANITQYVPYGGTVGNLIVLDYSRDMERQADALGTRILASSGYAADGLHNLMKILDKEERDRPIFAWLSTHPDTNERIRNVEKLINRNAYNRYAYEGVARHQEIQKRVAQLLKEYKEREKKDRD
jgi:hypothetical protein